MKEFRCKICGQMHPLFWEMATNGDRKLAYEHIEKREIWFKNCRTGMPRLKRSVRRKILYLPKRNSVVADPDLDQRLSKPAVKNEQRRNQLELSQIGLEL